MTETITGVSSMPKKAKKEQVVLVAGVRVGEGCDRAVGEGGSGSG